MEDKLIPIELTGLTGSSPVGALAAFGLLRICNEIDSLKNSRLAWSIENQDDWTAILFVPDKIQSPDLVQILSDYQSKRNLDAFSWSEDIRVRPEEYNEKLKIQALNAKCMERAIADFYAAFGSELITDGSKGLVKPTALHMTTANQKFLKIVNKLGERLKENSVNHIEEALFGPWLYKDEQHALGWDPAAERKHALRHAAPTSENPTSVAYSVWLSLEALPLFTTVPHRGRLGTTGFTRKNSENVFSWPIWNDPVGLDTLRSLLASSWKTKNISSLSQRSIVAIYQSVRSEFGQGYAIFRPSELVYLA